MIKSPDLRPACMDWPVTEADLLKAATQVQAAASDPCAAAVTALRAWQGGRCAICGQHEAVLVRDHDHESGLLRGLLCGGCNSAEGSQHGHHNALYRLLPPAVLLGLAVPWKAQPPKPRKDAEDLLAVPKKLTGYVARYQEQFDRYEERFHQMSPWRLRNLIKEATQASAERDRYYGPAVFVDSVVRDLFKDLTWWAMALDEFTGEFRGKEKIAMPHWMRPIYRHQTVRLLQAEYNLSRAVVAYHHGPHSRLSEHPGAGRLGRLVGAAETAIAARELSTYAQDEDSVYSWS
ncbi:endonuclease domain-containing protein [Longispora sp. NPDC051575]|uniref:endonuclease domain-containing protein n=1 Tax=Longispora sp. NPDC051575 TaxID=3154943 RepID=UPI0034187893